MKSNDKLINWEQFHKTVVFASWGGGDILPGEVIVFNLGHFQQSRPWLWSIFPGRSSFSGRFIVIIKQRL